MIEIRNIYYMLSYAFKILNEQGYKKIATEKFENTADLCSQILINGISNQIKTGLRHDYIENSECSSTVHGKINLSESINKNILINKQVICSYNDFSENCYLNRIIKSTVTMLISTKSNISIKRKKELKKLMCYFNNVDIIDLHSINWKIHYNKNNQTYRMLISVCWLIIKGLLQSTNDGTTVLTDFLDEQRMCRLYEKFILEYYRKEFPMIKVHSPQIPWQLDEFANTDNMLPVMQSDVLLSYKNNVLIIDAKYYQRITTSHYNKNTIRSANLYQIFTYVKNTAANPCYISKNIKGMLLYAKTDEEIYPNNNVYNMSGNQIIVSTLDLNRPFSEIKTQLNNIANTYLLNL